MKTPTRQDYMNGRATHEAYYGAIVREAGISLGFWTRLERVRRALEAGDEHLNTIPLRLWDELACSQRRAVEPVLREHGDFWSPAGGVCVAKEAARQAAAEEPRTCDARAQRNLGIAAAQLRAAARLLDKADRLSSRSGEEAPESTRSSAGSATAPSSAPRRT